MWGPFGSGAWTNQGNSETVYGTGGEYYQAETARQLQSAAECLNSRRYPDAQRILNSMTDRPARWYYFSAVSQAGQGNNVKALELARQALNLDPGRAEYRQLVSQLESGGSWYQSQENSYGGRPDMFCNNQFASLCAMSLCCSMMSGGRFCCI